MRASWQTQIKAEPCPEPQMSPDSLAAITFIDFSQNFRLSSCSSCLVTPHLTHFLTDNWCQPASRLCRAVASRHQEGSWHVPTKPSSNQSICCAIHNNNTNPSSPRKVSQVFKIGLSTRQHCHFSLWKYDWFR